MLMEGKLQQIKRLESRPRSQNLLWNPMWCSAIWWYRRMLQAMKIFDSALITTINHQGKDLLLMHMVHGRSTLQVIIIWGSKPLERSQWSHCWEDPGGGYRDAISVCTVLSKLYTSSGLFVFLENKGWLSEWHYTLLLGADVEVSQHMCNVVFLLHNKKNELSTARSFPMFIRSSHEMEPFATPHPWHLQWSQCDHIHKTMWSFDSSFVASIKKLLNKQSMCWWFEVPWYPCDVSITNFRQLCGFNITSIHAYIQQMIHECSVFIDKCPIKLVNCWSGPGREPVYENSCSPPWNGCCWVLFTCSSCLWR